MSGATFDTLQQLDAKLAAKGHHPLTRFWRATLERFYGHPSARTFVGRIGRGGAKSHTSAKVALNETLFGAWSVPPGERHYWAFASTNKEEAAQRLLLLQSFLRALSVPFDVAGDTISLRDLPRGFRVFAAQVGSVSGFRCFGYSADELAKWTSGNDYANPAGEVCTSLNAMTVTHPAARRLLISSPFATDDYHAEAFTRGDNETQLVAFAPTWVANESITEQQTKDLEPDPRMHQREYAAIPGNVETDAIDPDDVAAAFVPAPVARAPKAFIVLDPSSLRGDSFTWSVWNEVRGSLVMTSCDGVEGDELAHVTLSDVIDRIAKLAKTHRTTRVFSDQREAAALETLFKQRGLKFTAYNWTEPSKREAVMLIRRLLRDRKLFLCEHARLRREMLGIKCRLTPGGGELYRLNGRDFASLVVTAAHAAISRDVSADMFGDRNADFNRAFGGAHNAQDRWLFEEPEAGFDSLVDPGQLNRW